ncbi:MAG: hypothetical protein PHX40_04190 [Bacilli bacterium]|nr:hypothetical protein [Bacilli bacterium]
MSEDLSFVVKDEDGEGYICDVVSIIPNEENNSEPYVIFTDYFLDENNEFILQYGKLIKENDEDVLKPITDDNLINKIKEQSKDEIVSYVNQQILESYYE